MKTFFGLYGIILLLIASSCNNIADSKDKDNMGTIVHQVPTSIPITMSITKGELISKPLKGGEKYLFEFNLLADQYLHVEARQYEIDYKLTLHLPGSDSSLIFDTPNGQRGVEDLFYISKKSGTHIIELSPFSDYAQLASFDIVLKTLRDATEEDKIWIKNYEKMRTANRLRSKKETRHQAVKEFEKLIPVWEQIGDTYQKAVAKRSLGYTLRALGKKEEAIKMFESVLLDWQKLGEIRYEAFTYLILAGIHKSNEEYEKALPLTFQSIEKWKKAGDIVQECKAYSDVASFYMMQGEAETSKTYYDKSMDKAIESGRLSVLGVVLREYGNAWKSFGDDAKVMEYYTKSLNTYNEMGHLPAQALLFRMMGDFLFNKNRIEEAKPYFKQAIEIYQELGNEKLVSSLKQKLGAIEK